MRFSVNLKKLISSSLILAGIAVWTVGCAEQSSTPSKGTPLTKPPQSGSTTGKGREVPEPGPAATGSDSKPAEEMPADEKPADEKPADEKPADEKPGE